MRRMGRWKTELRDNGVFVAAYDNPPMNYFTGQATVELGELLARWRDPDVKAVVISGAQSGKYITHYSVEELIVLGQRLGLDLARPPLGVVGWSGAKRSSGSGAHQAREPDRMVAACVHHPRYPLSHSSLGDPMGQADVSVTAVA